MSGMSRGCHIQASFARPKPEVATPFDPVTASNANLGHRWRESNLFLWEKGVRWDPKKRRSQDDYESFIARLLERRLARLRPAQPAPD
jgi:hypothetical protein